MTGEKPAQKIGGSEKPPIADLNRPSLRATGSRECAPDDRLREAIHLAAPRKNGLLRSLRSSQ
jgi:hypothetical protein